MLFSDIMKTDEVRYLKSGAGASGGYLDDDGSVKRSRSKMLFRNRGSRWPGKRKRAAKKNLTKIQ